MAFDPYAQWLLIPAGRRPPSYYRLLQISAVETAEDRIREAGNQQYERVRRNQLGPQRHLVAGLLSEISRGMDCLIDPQRRAEYRAQWLRDTIEYWLHADRAAADVYELVEEFPFTPAQQHLRQTIAAVRRCLDESNHDQATANRAGELRGVLDAAEAALADPAAYEQYHRPVLARLQEDAVKKFGDNRRRWNAGHLRTWLAEAQWIHPARTAAVARSLAESQPQEQQRLLREMFPSTAPPVRTQEKPEPTPLPDVLPAVVPVVEKALPPVVPVATTPLPTVKAIVPAGQSASVAKRPLEPVKLVKPSSGGVPWYISCPLIGATLLGAWLVVRPHLDFGDTDVTTAENPSKDTEKNQTAPWTTNGGQKPPRPDQPGPAPKPDIAPTKGSAWEREGMLLRLTVYDGEVHMLVSNAAGNAPGSSPPPFGQLPPPDPRGLPGRMGGSPVPSPGFPGPPGMPSAASSAMSSVVAAAAFEAFTDEADFDAQLIDYCSLREYGKSERVLVKGTVCGSDEAGYRLDDKVPLVGIQQIQKPGQPDSLIVVDGPKRTAAQLDPSIAGLSRLLRSPPEPKTEVEFSCYVQDFNAQERTLYVSPSLGTTYPGPVGNNGPIQPARVPVQLVESRTSRATPFRGLRVHVVARVATSGLGDLVLEAGEVLPDPTREKENWRNARQNPDSMRYSTLAMTGVFQSRSEKFSQTLQQEQACIGVRKLFWEDEYFEAFYVPSPSADQFLAGLKDGDRLLFSVRQLTSSRPSLPVEKPAEKPEYIVTRIARASDPGNSVSLSSSVTSARPRGPIEPLPRDGQRLAAHSGAAAAVAFSPNGKYLASVGRGVNGNLKVWDVASLREFAVPNTVDNGTSILAWWGMRTTSDPLLITASQDPVLKGWTINASERSVARMGTDIRLGASSFSTVTCLAWNEDASRMAVGSSDGVLLIYSVEQLGGGLQMRGAPKQIALGRWLTAVQWRPTSATQLAVGDQDGTIWIVDAARPRLLAGRTANRERALSRLSQPGLDIDPPAPPSRPTGKAKKPSRPPKTTPKALPKSGPMPEVVERPASFCYQLAWTPDGKTLTAGQPLLEFWEVQSNGTMSWLNIALPGVGPQSYRKFAWDRSGNFLAVAGKRGSLTVWRKDNATQMSALRDFPCSDDVNSLQFSPDGTSLAAACNDGSVYMFKEPTRAAPAGAATPDATPPGLAPPDPAPPGLVPGGRRRGPQPRADILANPFEIQKN